MINLILHTMKKEEQLLGFLNMLGNVLDKTLKDIKENEHHFDANSNECKECECFVVCKEFTSLLKAVADSDYDKDVKTDLAAFLIFMKKEYLFVNEFDIEDILKDDDSALNGYYKRFESVVKEFKNYDKLVQILDDNQLNLIRKIILDVVAKIEELMNKIMDRNRAESVILISKLQKPQLDEKQEEKSYEDMTKEELIELLKHK